MTNNYKSTMGQKPQEFMSIQDLLYLCLGRWYWFVISLSICLGLGICYLLVTPSVYTRNASLLIKDDSKGKSVTSEMESFADLGLFTSNANVNSEIVTLKSRDLMREVVARLNLNIEYRVDKRFQKPIIYGKQLPIHVKIIDFPDNGSANFVLKLGQEGNVSLSDFIQDGDELVSPVLNGMLNDTIATPLGNILVTPTSYFSEISETKIFISHNPLIKTSDSFSSRLNVALEDEKSNVISLSLQDVSPQRGDEVLNTLISVYNENWVKDKNQIAVSTSMFINDRLGVIEGELGNVDKDISSFKSEHLLPDIHAAASMYMEQANQASASINALNSQVYMARYIKGYLTNETNNFQLLPSNSGIDNQNISFQINEYNERLLERNSLVAQSSTSNPLVVQIDASLSAMRSALAISIDNQLVALNEQIKMQRAVEGKATSKIASNPQQSKYLLSVERQQKVKESLYLYLLQKREENELSQAFTAYNTRIVTMPGGSMLPTEPLPLYIILFAFAMGLAIPTILIFLKESTNTRIRGRKDLENLNIPFVGEIPLFIRKKKGVFAKKAREVNAIVVQEGKRDIINEAFRVLRTNLEFIMDTDKTSNVIIITSFNPGSGKSFLSMNMAISLAIKEKKVLVIDGDMRHASASAYINSPATGLSDYLSGRVGQLADVIVTDKLHEHLDILPVGTIPPNPTELLFSERLKQVIDITRKKYDYVLIDCPPIELVADTQIIEKLADRTVFVLRAGLLERSMLPELENIYREKKYKNMSIILNGTIGSAGRYGYHYGYGNGYYYGSNQNGGG